MDQGEWQHYWLDKDHRVVHTTMSIRGQGQIMARVDLRNGSVVVIEGQPADPSTIVTPRDKADILHTAQAWELDNVPIRTTSVGTKRRSYLRHSGNPGNGSTRMLLWPTLFVTGLTKHVVNGTFSVCRMVGTRYSAILGIRVWRRPRVLAVRQTRISVPRAASSPVFRPNLYP